MVPSCLPSFINSLTTSIAAIGMAIDPLTNDLLVTNFAGVNGGPGHVYVISGFAPVAGDFNAGGKINAADYVVWRKGLGTTCTQADYDLWRSHFGQTAGSGSGASANASVPEPMVFVMLTLAATSSGFPRRRTA